MDTHGDEGTTIRAVVRDGAIQPLDPLPDRWAEGQELQVLGPGPLDGPDEIDAWLQETEALAKEVYDPQSFAGFEAAIAEADRHAKAWMRREMGLE
jgi:hypothetical protein